ncbi:putative ABC transport system ATP-binding protein [Ruminiclostridium sufflavum DSM 19573]|uniref:Putative ABC transport system ATP-binding protein n=2 Tax=Ruminiclostridium TaxID=1508657 RepID=A0A318XYV0_9FIRM|nr:putative ABC transport system ATP-binding protein [Ruminiclostridium sufflavum DSM 19573]
MNRHKGGIAMSNNIVLETKKVTKEFSNSDVKNQILKGIDLQVEKGEFMSVMGPSGCGKSTFLYLLGGLDKPTDGQVMLFDQDINKLSERKRSKLRCSKIGFVFQFYNLVQGLSVAENIMLPLVMAGVKAEKKKKELNDILEVIGMTDKYKCKPSQLSGGQQQRVAIARALITQPDLILADEPIGNLDSVSGETVMKLLRDINQQYKTTIVQVTHSAGSAQYGTSIIRMKDGKILTSEKVEK